LAVAGSGIGNLALPPIATVLIEKYGWRVAFRILSVFPVLTVLAAFLLKRRVPSQRKWGFDGATKTREFILLFISGLFIGYGYLIPFVHMSPFAIDAGVPSVQASLLLSIMGGSSFIGRIVLGLIADRLHNRVMILRICYGVMGLVTFSWPFLRNFYGKIL
jgi:predicted MFS family arabinose efflux permease